MKKIFGRLILLILITITIIIIGISNFIVNYGFDKEIFKVLRNEKTRINLVLVGFPRGNYLIGNQVDVKESLLFILSMKDGLCDFKRGGEYEFFQFMAFDGGKGINITVKLDSEGGCLELDFRDGRKHYYTKKKIQSMDELHGFIEEISVSKKE